LLVLELWYGWGPDAVKEDDEQLSVGGLLGVDDLTLRSRSRRREIDSRNRSHMRHRAPCTRGVPLGLRMIVGVTGLRCHKDKQREAQCNGRNLTGIEAHGVHRMMLSGSHYSRKTRINGTIALGSWFRLSQMVIQ